MVESSFPVSKFSREQKGSGRGAEEDPAYSPTMHCRMSGKEKDCFLLLMGGNF